MVRSDDFQNGATATLERPAVELGEATANAPSPMDVTSLATADETNEPPASQKLLQQIKDAGMAGVLSYAAWEFAFWFVSVPVVLVGYREVTGEFPDLSNKEDIAKLSAEAFAFVNFARFAVPLRLGT
jgi:hypothetical protein